MDFNGKYKPQCHKDPDEYWITFEDFRCNFGGLIICSDSAPYRTEGMNIERCYRRLSEEEIKPVHKAIFKERKPGEKKQPRHSVPSYCQYNKRLSIPEIQENGQRDKTRCSIPRSSVEVKDQSKARQEIYVKEVRKTVKIDNTYRKAQRRGNHSKWSIDSNEPSITYGLRRLRKERYTAHDVAYDAVGKCSSVSNADIKAKAEETYNQFRSGSISSDSSLLSQCPSTFSASDITVHFQSNCGLSREDSLKRPRSAPGTGNALRKASTGSLPNVTVSNFLATSFDHFQSHGSWKQIIDYKGSWDSKSKDLGLDATKPVFGVSKKVRFKPACSETETSYTIEIVLVASSS